MKRIINQQRGTQNAEHGTRNTERFKLQTSNFSNFLCSVFSDNFTVFSTKINSSTMKRIINQQRGTRNTERGTFQTSNGVFDIPIYRNFSNSQTLSQPLHYVFSFIFPINCRGRNSTRIA